MNHGKVKSVYRLGSVTAPGISDLDMFVVFKDNASTAYDPLAKLDDKGKYLFVHRLFGASQSHFQEVLRLTTFTNYRLIGGEDCRTDVKLDSKDDLLLKKQTALEFMIKMFMVMSIQSEYKIIKVRAFLLEARAMEYDLEFLGVSSGKFFDVVQEIIEFRKKWFLSSGNVNQIEDLFERFYLSLTELLNELLRKEKFYTNGNTSGRFSRNVKWTSADKLSISKRGLPLPAFFATYFQRNYFKIMNKVSLFTMKIPAHADTPLILKERFALFREMAAYNKKFIPEFMTPESGLKMN
jgi:hypothetical protein